MFKSHYPPHYYVDQGMYFITSRTVDKRHYFNTDRKKELIRKILVEAKNKFNISFYAWVILENHYHILMKILKGEMLPNFMKTLNGKSSFLLNKIDMVKKRKVWFNYWDTCIRSEKDFWTRFNYIHHNPVKHNYVNRMEDYKFSSHKNWVEKKGMEFLSDAFERYPIYDFTVDEDV